MKKEKFILKEKDIRPKKLLDENSKLLMEDITNILKLKDSFIKINCPACNCKKYDYLFDKEGFSFVICKNCKTVFTNPRPTKEQLASYYATSKCYAHYNNYLFPATEKLRREKIFIPRAKKIAELCERYSIKKNVLIDAGAGFGTFCEEVSRMSIFETIIAVEPSMSLAETCRKIGITVCESPIEDAHLKNADVITGFELIEHLFWPKEFILSCARLLSQSGFLYLTAPNIKGFDMVVLGKYNDNIIAPNHLNLFHPDSLCKLISSCGMEIIEVTTPGLLDVELVSKKVKSGEITLDEQPFLKDLFSRDNIMFQSL